MNEQEFSSRLAQIELENLDNPFQQGYLSAPVIAEFLNFSADDIKGGIEGRTSATDDDHHRDMGALQWCREQLK